MNLALINEKNKLKLPELVNLLRTANFITNLPPLVERRLKWDFIKQSRLIESFISNIPIPSLVFYEQSYKSYEVLDGKERISAIEAFYEDKVILIGLEYWSQFNGLTYSQLPSHIKDKLNHHSISYTAIIEPIDSTPQQVLNLKELVMKRLNQ
jgi:hypothetical protein